MKSIGTNLASFTVPGANSTSIRTENSTTTITTPQSVNLDFQTGIMANTVAFANVRWVKW